MSMAIIVMLAFVVAKKVTSVTSFNQHELTSVISTTTVEQHADKLGVVVSVNQAANFTHLQQISIDYFFILLVALCIAPLVSCQLYKPIILPLPWYLVLRHSSRFKIAGWKSSNLSYKFPTALPY